MSDVAPHLNIHVSEDDLQAFTQTFSAIIFVSENAARIVGVHQTSTEPVVADTYESASVVSMPKNSSSERTFPKNGGAVEHALITGRKRRCKCRCHTGRLVRKRARQTMEQIEEGHGCELCLQLRRDGHEGVVDMPADMAAITAGLDGLRRRMEGIRVEVEQRDRPRRVFVGR
jgi:hypothetical protein